MKLSSDIYEISDFVNQIQKKYMRDLSEETLSMSLFGAENEIFSKTIQNSVIMAAEWGNEAIPTKTRFERNILTNAVTYNISDINAVPATMEVMLGFIKRELDSMMVNDKFIINKSCPIYIEDFEFHLDYNIMITRSKINDKEYTYSAKYVIDVMNPLSNILNPYLQSPINLNIDNSDFIFIIASIRQVEIRQEYTKIISNNILENKTFEFNFEDQLASFDIMVEENGKTINLIPIFEGMPSMSNDLYCFYTYIDANTIRVKFDRNSYEPKLNCNIKIDIQTTRGSVGNFVYKDDVITTLDSIDYNYNNMNMLVRPISESMMGIDRKSVSDLKQIIPKEILSRGNIINNRDLENFFNMIDANNKLFFYRKRDNQQERLYYGYLIIKDAMNNIIPTNTIHIDINENDFDIIENDRYILNPGRLIAYDGEVAKVLPKDSKIDEDMFTYSTPFIIIINKNPLSVSYYLTVINRSYNFNYVYINNNSDLQFISNNMSIYKNYLEGDNYKINATMVQNINVDKGLVEYDQDGNIVKYKIKPVLVIENNNYKYYKFGEILNYDQFTYGYDVEFELETDNIINKQNKIKIKNMLIDNTDTLVDLYLDESVKISICMYIENPKRSTSDGPYISIPSINNTYTMTNRYETLEMVNLFYNYSSTISSIALLKGKDEEVGYKFNIKSVPLLKYSYIDNIDRCNDLIDYIQFRKVYIDTALKVLEGSFSIDLKFFNTYGPSKTFNIGHEKEKINRVNLTMKFKIKTLAGADKDTKDHIVNSIKNYMENINNIQNIHVSNLTAYVKEEFKSDIEFIEFVGMNGYDSTNQYIEKEDVEIIEQVPEFLNINLKNNVEPDIEIIVL